MNFGQAIEAMKEGREVYRTGWNGKNMHIYLEDHFTLGIPHPHGKIKRTYDPVFCMVTAQGTHQPGWLASQADMLAEDWVLRG